MITTPLPPIEDSLLAAALEERLGGSTANIPRARPPRNRAMAAAILVGGIACVFTVAMLRARGTPVPAQDPQPTQKEHAMAATAFWPLHPGNRWRYRETSDQGEAEVEVIASVSAGSAIGDIVQLIEARGDSLAVSFWRADAQGVFAIPSAGVTDDPLLDAIGEAACWLPSPVGAETRWQHRWLPSRPLPLGVGRRLRATANDFVSVDLEFLGLSEPVTVPAGTHSCAHLRAVSETSTGRLEQHVWLARRIGPVRTSRQLDNGPKTLRELIAFTPAPPTPPPAAVLATATGNTTPPAWLSLPIDEDTVWTMRSRFALVGNGEQRRWYRVCGDRATPFRPDAIDDWQQLAVDEDHAARQDGLFPQRQCVGLCRLAARMHALEHGLAVVDSGADEVTIGQNSVHVDFHATFRDQAGARTTRRYELKTRDGKPATFRSQP